MCDIAMVSMGVMAAMSIGSTVMQMSNANYLAKAEGQAATEAATADYAALTQREQQIDTQATTEKLERQRQGMRERALLRVTAGEAGIGGITPIREQANSLLQESYDTGILEYNRENRIDQTEVEKQKVYADAKGRMNVARSKTQGGFMAGLQIGAAGLSGAASGLQFGNTLNSRTSKKTGGKVE